LKLKINVYFCKIFHRNSYRSKFMIDRINLILKAKNITAKQFAEEIGVQPSGMSHILSGRNNPSLDFVMKVIRRYPEIDMRWLTLGEGQMYNTENNDVVTAANSQPLLPQADAPQADQFSVANASPATNASPDVAFGNNITSSAPDLFSSIEPVLEFGDVNEEQPVAPKETAPVVPKPEKLKPVAVETVEQPVMADEPKKDDGLNAPSKPEKSTECEETNETTDLSDDVEWHEKREQRKEKKVIKMILIYDDHTFEEYCPRD